MLSRPSNLKAAAAVLLVFSLTGCQHTVHRPTYSDPVTGTTEPAPAAAPSAKTAPRVKYSPTYDKEIREIMDLAREDRWEEAQQKATDLLNKDPKDSIVTRVYSWVNQQAQQRRAQSLEDKIRSIDARNSVFSPTPKSLLKEQRDRGLPPRRAVLRRIPRGSRNQLGDA